MADLRDGAPPVCASPYGPKFSQFHVVLWNIWQNCRLAPPPGGLVPPPTGNPGSAPDNETEVLFIGFWFFVSWRDTLGTFSQKTAWQGIEIELDCKLMVGNRNNRKYQETGYFTKMNKIPTLSGNGLHFYNDAEERYYNAFILVRKNRNTRWILCQCKPVSFIDSYLFLSPDIWLESIK